MIGEHQVSDASNDPRHLTLGEFEHWLSPPRARRYLRAADEDLQLACELYDWNSRVAAAALTDTFHLEVALRNAYDRVMCAHVPNWSADPQLKLLQLVRGHPSSHQTQRDMNVKSMSAIQTARQGLGVAPEHGRIISDTTFGFWTSLTHPQRAQTYWGLLIGSAYPKGTQRGDVHALVTNVNKFRNRLAHSEAVFSATTGLRERLADVHSLFDMLDPSAGRWVQSHSSVAQVVADAPVSGLVAL